MNKIALLEKQLLLAKKTNRIQAAIKGADKIFYHIIFNSKTSWENRFKVLQHIQLKYDSFLVTLNTNNDLIIRHV